MTYKWIKQGLLYCPCDKGRHQKLLTHAANPLPILLKDNIYRIFYSGRDINNKSSICAVDIDIIKKVIIKEHHEPFFEYGCEGSFYANGLSLGNSYEVHGTNYLLFMGWQSLPLKHWRGDIGRLIIKSDFTLGLESSKPIISSDKIDPLSLSYPCVLKKNDNLYYMWYGSTIDWCSKNGEMIHVINVSVSFDGHNWIKKGLCVPYHLGVAQAFSRPTVIENHSGGFDMWFSYRGDRNQKYRIGYAHSINGQEWNLLLNSSGIDVSTEGWDSEMIEYPFVFDHKGERYMLYNGNGYGKTGFGLAVLN